MSHNLSPSILIYLVHDRILLLLRARNRQLQRGIHPILKQLSEINRMNNAVEAHFLLHELALGHMPITYIAEVC